MQLDLNAIWVNKPLFSFHYFLIGICTKSHHHLAGQYMLHNGRLLRGHANGNLTKLETSKFKIPQF